MRANLETRAERAKQFPPREDYSDKQWLARQMWVAGMTHQQIADHFDSKRSTVAQWIRDPKMLEATKRKDRYRTPCIDCGKLTNPNGRRDVKRCKTCSTRLQHETRKWTPERIIEELRAWAVELGRTPVAQDAFGVPGPRVPGSAVAREFGSWAKGLDAAGLRNSGQGRNPRGRRLNQEEEEAIVMHYRSGMSMSAVGRKMQVSPAGVRLILDRRGIPRRGRVRKLTEIQEREMVRMYKEGQSYAKIAEAMDISTSTVWKKIKKHGVPLRRESRLAEVVPIPQPKRRWWQRRKAA